MIFWAFIDFCFFVLFICCKCKYNVVLFVVFHLFIFFSFFLFNIYFFVIFIFKDTHHLIVNRFHFIFNYKYSVKYKDIVNIVKVFFCVFSSFLLLGFHLLLSYSYIFLLVFRFWKSFSSLRS